MRFEVAAAFVVGILLPALETLRRGIAEWATDFSTMFEDYLGGALLLAGAWAVRRRRRWGDVLLLVAWSAVAAVMTMSTLNQLEETLRGTVEEPAIVLTVKALLWCICLLALVGAFRHVTRGRESDA